MKKYKFVLMPLAVAGMIALTTVLFTLPKLKAVLFLKIQINQAKEKLARLTQKASLLEGLDHQVLEKKVAVVEQALPSKKFVSTMISALGRVSQETGVSFIDFEIEPGEMTPEKYETLIFKAVFRGDRHKIEAFLVKIKQVLPVMRVVGFKIKRGKTTLEIESYSSPLPQSLGKVDNPLPEITRPESEAYQTINQYVVFEKELPSVATGKEDLFSGL